MYSRQTFSTPQSLPSIPRQTALGRGEVALVLLLSAVIPPVLLFAAWKTPSFRQRHLLLTLFVGWYAVSLPIAYDPLGVGSDGVRHLLAVYVHYVDMSFGQFMSDLQQILLFQGAESSNDAFRHVLGYFVGGVLGIPELFFPIVGLVYGYFFSGSMLIIFRELGQRKIPWVIIFLGLCFFLTRNIESLQAVRNPTAGWMLIYGVLRYQQTKHWRYLVLMGATPLIHFSFLMLAVPAFAYVLIGNRRMLFAVLFAISIPFDFITPDVAIDLVSQVEIGEQKLLDRSDRGRADLTARAELVEQQMADGTRLWRAYMQAGYQRYALNILIFGIILSGMYFRMNRFSGAIFSTGLLYLTASNALWFLGGATGRLGGLGLLLVLAGFLIWRLSAEFKSGNLRMPGVYVAGCYLSALILVPYFLFHLSRIMDFINLNAFAFPWVARIYPDANLTVKEILRFFLPI